MLIGRVGLRRALLATVLAAALVPTGSGAAVTPTDVHAAAWQQAPPIAPPNASPSDPSVVTGVACPAPANCAMAGSYRTSDGAPAGFLGTSTAGAVTIVAAPVPADGATGANAQVELSDTACAAAGDCVAVGAYRASDGNIRPLVETLADGEWTAGAVPLPGSATAISVQLVDVDCNPTGCAAIGSYQQIAGQSRGLALQRDNASGQWRAEDVSLPTGAVTAQGLGVACPATGTCVGYGSADERPTLLYPSTDSWRAVYLPVPDGVDSTTLDVRGMSCTGPGDCVALGSYPHPAGSGRGVVAEWLRSGALSVTSVRLPSSLGHRTIKTGPISCAAAGSCAAVGTLGAPGHPARAVLFTLRGRTWTAAPAPAPAQELAGGSAQLAAISCPVVGSCIAVGGFDREQQLGHVLQRPYAVELAAGTWTASGLGRPANLPGVVSGALFVLSCADASCLAAGTDVRYDSEGGVQDYGAFLVRRS